MNILPVHLSGIQPIQPAGPLEIGGSARPSGESDFGKILQGAIDQVEGSRADANQSVQNFLSGDGEDLHSTVLAVQRADLELEMLMQVRNKVISAYQEVMRMQMQLRRRSIILIPHSHGPSKPNRRLSLRPSAGHPPRGGRAGGGWRLWPGAMAARGWISPPVHASGARRRRTGGATAEGGRRCLS